MAQPFDCLCGTPSCRGRIAGARDMTRAQLDGLWLNGHIRELLEERDHTTNGHHAGGFDDAGRASTAGAPLGAQRRGPTSRELSGEMGGDTSVRV